MLPIAVLAGLLIGWPRGCEALCADTSACIARVRQIASAPRRFWFGEQRRAACDSDSKADVHCVGPPHLSSFHSLGSRLFRARTYHSAYLANLRVFPRVTYRAAPGTYRACDHEYDVSNVSAIEADPDMAPAEPFLVRRRPDISWHGLEFDERHTVLIADVGFGTLNYLVTDFPANTKILHEYEGSENFRPLANPLVVVVFNGSREITVRKTDDFDLSQFMIDNSLEDELIGMAIVVVGSDAYAIERQRLRGTIDNCHSLLQEKLSRDVSWANALSLPYEELSSWITVSVDMPHVDARLCCQHVQHNASRLVVDPLGNGNVSALATLTAPVVTMLPLDREAFNSYHRHVRTYISLLDQFFTVAIVDAENGNLQWMIVDVPHSRLNVDQPLDGVTKAEFEPLVPTRASTCREYVIVVMRQTHSLAQLTNYCQGHCAKRKHFQLDSFKQKFGLRLTATSWLRSCYDLAYLAYDARRHSHITKRRSHTATHTCSTFGISSTTHCHASYYKNSAPATKPTATTNLLVSLIFVRVLLSSVFSF